jgi:hypothetical protein
VTAGGATGADLLDRHKAMFAPGNCQRTENTFSNGEGAFIANRAGPVRALRGYVGANSGPTTYRVHTFYESREDILTALRVHAIPGIMDLFDYAPAASGMIYRNDLNPGGVPIDGNPDAVAPGAVRGEMVTGSQGTLAMTSLLDTNIPGFTVTSYYSDDSTPPVTQCTGDAFEYGTSGFWRNGSIPNTDPALGAYYVLEGRRVIAYAAPGQDAAFALHAAGGSGRRGAGPRSRDPPRAQSGAGRGPGELRAPGRRPVRAAPLRRHGARGGHGGRGHVERGGARSRLGRVAPRARRLLRACLGRRCGGAAASPRARSLALLLAAPTDRPRPLPRPRP